MIRFVTFPAIILVACCLPLSAQAQKPSPELTQEEQSACTSDAIRMCFINIGQADSMRACLRRNKPNLSTSCRKLIESRGG